MLSTQHPSSTVSEHSRPRRRTVAGALAASTVALVSAAALTTPAVADEIPAPDWFVGFEAAEDVANVGTALGDLPSDAINRIERVENGEGELIAPSGCFYGEAPVTNYDTHGTDGFVFSYMGGVSDVWPGDYDVSAKFYLDTDAAAVEDELRLDWSTALNNTSGTHLRDFAFNVSTLDGDFLVSASNGVKSTDGAGTHTDPAVITESGWYTFTHQFTADSETDVVSVDLVVTDDDGEEVGSWTLSQPTDIVGDNVGGHRYGWLVWNDFENLAVDDLARGADLTTGSYGFCPPQSSDVSAEHPFAEEISWFENAGITDGYDDGTFRPTAPVTRQAMAAFLFRFADEDEFTAPVDATFSDVPVTHPFFEEIEWLADAGITEGYDDDTFRPTAGVSRMAMAAFINRLAGSPMIVTAGQSFTDVPPTHPFYNEIEWLASTGVTEGYEDDTFRPSSIVSRQAMAAFLFRFAEYEAPEPTL